MYNFYTRHFFLLCFIFWIHSYFFTCFFPFFSLYSSCYSFFLWLSLPFLLISHVLFSSASSSVLIFFRHPLFFYSFFISFLKWIIFFLSFVRSFEFYGLFLFSFWDICSFIYIVSFFFLLLLCRHIIIHSNFHFRLVICFQSYFHFK